MSHASPCQPKKKEKERDMVWISVTHSSINSMLLLKTPGGSSFIQLLSNSLRKDSARITYMFFFSSLFFTRFFDHLTLTYLLTTASKLKQSSFKFQERTESERIEDTYNNSEFLLESCDMSLMESS